MWRAISAVMAGLAVLCSLAVPSAARAQASASPFTNAQRYDAMGRVTGTISASPDDGNPFLAVRNSYNGAGQLIRVESGSLAAWQSEAVAPASWSGFTVYWTRETLYDAIGRKTRETLREGAAGAIRTMTQYSYDIMGRLECTAVRMNPAQFGAMADSAACTLGTAGSDGPDRITRNIYDWASQRLQLRVGVGTSDEAAEATWAYNLDGQVTAVTDGNGNRAELHYDGHGRQDRWTFPSAAGPAGTVNASDYEEYGYDPNGNRTSLRKRDGAVLTYQYDSLNRMTVKIVPERSGLTAAQTCDVHYGYDLRGLQLHARFDSPSGPGIVNQYDGFGRLASTTANTDGTARTLAYEYDANGNRTRITHPDTNWFVTVRDGLGRPFWLNSVQYPAHGCYYSSYRPNGLPSGQSRCNGSSTWTSRDGVGRLNGLGHYYGTGGSGDATWLYNHNPASQIRSVNRDNDSYAWTGHYAVNRAYATNGLNQHVTAGGATFGHDLNGNLASEPAPGGGVRTYTYDVENRLVGASTGAQLAYDPLGRLYQVTAASGAITRFLYDGDALVAEYDGAGEMIRRYIHWEGADVPIMSYANASLATPTYLHPDHQGSIVAISGASGASQINRYDEYGIPAATNAGRFQYTGQAWLAELGLYYYKGRLYSPTLGRFLQTDPVGYQDQFNLYAYVGNDPVNATDPTGTSSRPPTGCGSHTRWDSSSCASGEMGPEPGLASEGGEGGTQQPRQQGQGGRTAGWDAHDFPVGPFFICEDSARCRAVILEVFPYYIVPNLGERVSDRDISPIYLSPELGLSVGHVRTRISPDGLSATNYTLSDHWLRYGRVDITNQLSGGRWYVGAHGYGTNFPGVGTLNQAFGPGIFTGMLQTYVMVVRSRLGN